MNLIEKLNWRYAVKKFDPERALPAGKLDTILESVRLSASAFGLQPYRLVVVDDPVIRQSLVEHSMNQDKVANASQLLVFAIEQAVAIYFCCHFCPWFYTEPRLNALRFRCLQ